MLKQKGLTLIEIMVVVVILGILAAIIVPKIMTRPEEARIVKAKQDILAIQDALNLYKLDSGSYPSTDQGLAALVKEPSASPAPSNWQGPYLRAIPVDPWGRDYQYINEGAGNILIFTYGKDGKPGGTGMDAEISNLTIQGVSP